MTDKPVRVLVVEDERAYADALEIGLRREGFEVAVSRDGIAALSEFDRRTPDIVLLDLMLPGIPGTDVCRRIRTKSNVPVLMLTAKDSEVDTVLGLELGADGYITKPYRMRELIARMRAALRRPELANDTGGAADGDEVLTVGPIRLDPRRHAVHERDQEVDLPLKEFELLEALMLNAGLALSRSTLMNTVWGYDFVGETKTLDVHIQRLRSRIEVDPAKPVLITTIRGVGYRFEKAEENT